jgi:hypothetical protein
MALAQAAAASTAAPVAVAPAAAAAPAAAKGKPDPKAAAAAAAAPAAATAAAAADASTAITLPPVTGYKILCNREVVAQRNQCVALYAAFFQAEVAAAVQLTQNADREEEKWTENWRKLIRQLKE